MSTPWKNISGMQQAFCILMGQINCVYYALRKRLTPIAMIKFLDFKNQGFET